MSALMKAVHICKTVNNVTKLLANLSVSSSPMLQTNAAIFTRVPPQITALFHTTSRQNDLMEFFDEKENWKKDYIKTGRSWRKDDLRIKSNEDLHKLWFVLLKERNMLMTMEKFYIDNDQELVSPERLDKVEESMENIESVVRERNKAYHMLETGEDGERPGKFVYNPIGLQYYYRMSEHKIPRQMNVWWKKNYKFGFGGYAVRKFLRLYKEKQYRQTYNMTRRRTAKVARLFQLYPNLDVAAIEKQYPDVDVAKLLKDHKQKIYPQPTN